MAERVRLGGKAFALREIKLFLEGASVVVNPDVITRLRRVRRFVEQVLDAPEPHYGINTGFGLLAGRRIPRKDLARLQEHLIISHAVGVGEPLDAPVVRLMMLFRANVLAMGYSGVRPEVLSLLVAMINRDILPVVPEKGSVGASGDLAPLAHLALAMIGRGEVRHCGKVRPARVALRDEDLRPIVLQAKEGIALINGTQAMLAMGAFALVKVENLLRAADVVAALSVEGDRASRRPFDPRVQELRPHPGQRVTAANIRKLIRGSRVIASHAQCTRVQDPYSFRCVPQVHGAVKDACAYAREVIARELGSCTDNPLIFADEGEILSGGNFHGEPLAIALDTLGIAVAELGSISERRVAILTAPLAGEIGTMFLTRNAGLNSGLMIPHVTMSALVAENKILAHPASVDSIPTSGGQEDHVSMGAAAARKALEIIENVERILSIELFAACQAIEFQKKYGKTGRGTSAVYALVRRLVPPIEEDREFRHDMEKCHELLCSGAVVRAAEAVCGPLGR